MDRKKAEEYLIREGEINNKPVYSGEEEKKIEEVMKKGKIYGDPTAEIQW